ncbi:MAG: UDP-N-acetylmuramoyl-tripeptide--D-alanyl-D-alanine ligase [Bacillota bacterium]|nr:UDP-N-acetylmuramoyl-tripeptide--D-alanyl-D-alanine ligase [Bacillota bacterium]
MSLFFIDAAAFLCMGFLFLRKLRFSVHMLQQTGYKSKDFLKWCDENLMRNLSFIELAAMAVSLCIFFFLDKYGVPQIGFLNAAVTMLLVSLGVFPFSKYSSKKAKKPLVYTPRVKRLFAACAVLTVILLGGLGYVCLRIPAIYPVLYLAVLMTVFNFVFTAFANIVVRPIELAINHYYYKDAKRILASMPDLKIIGITGSYGKTSSKYILTRILSEKFNTLMTPESYNTPMGVIKTIRTNLNPTHEIFVCEMGAKYRKDISELCELVRPQYGLLTSIGPQHLETFKTLRNIIDTKFDLINSLQKKSHSILNMENKYIRDEAPAGSVGYSVDYVNGTDFWAEDISYGPEGVRFTLCSTKGERIALESRLLGRHNILNIVGAVAAAVTLGMDIKDVVYPIKRLEPVPHRLELRHKSNGVTVIDDAFNSNIEGAKSAVEVLGSFPAGGRILITPGIVEAGEKEYELNFEFARHCGEFCDYIILVGEKQTKPIAAGLNEIGYDKDRLFISKDLNEALSIMNTLATSGSTVLFENDLPDLYNEQI